MNLSPLRTLALRSFLFLLGGAWLSAQPNPSPTPARAPDLASNPAPEVTPLDPKVPTLFVAGDSTAARGKGESQQGWGVPLADYFDASKINVANRARGGRSSRTFITEGLWDQLLADLKAGDTVLIQFGHNDGGALNDEPPPPLRARGSIPGIGEETKEIDNVLTKKHEVVHTYGWYLRKMIADVKAKDATPIVLSTTVRAIWKEGHLERGPGSYRQWSYNVAKSAGVRFFDVAGYVGDKLEPLGEAKVHDLYPQDHTHFNAVGADLHASAVVAGLKGLRVAAVRNALSEKGTAVEADRDAAMGPLPANPALPSLFLIGDSTVRNGQDDGQGKGAEGQWGWGNPIAAYFDPAKINVVNRAVGGLSSRTFFTQHWDRTLARIKPGDFVIMQFGHNDNGALNDEPPGPLRARGTLPGIGEETKEIDNVLTKKHEVVHSYGWYLRKMIADTRAKGATPIVCSLIPRKTWDEDGHILRNQTDYAGWAAAVAQQEKAPFIDLNERVARQYDALGHDAVMKLFPQVTPDEHTHPNWAGAELNAATVIAGLKELKDDPLAPYLGPKAAAQK